MCVFCLSVCLFFCSLFHVNFLFFFFHVQTRTLKHVSKFTNDRLEEIIKKNLLVRFVPENSRDILLEIIKKTITDSTKMQENKPTDMNNNFDIGKHEHASKLCVYICVCVFIFIFIYLQINKHTETTPASKRNDSYLVPFIEFHDIPQHVEILNSIYKDYVLGEHMLLMVNKLIIKEGKK
jgi:hypothetical protein